MPIASIFVEVFQESEHPALRGLPVHLEKLEGYVIRKLLHDPRSCLDRVDTLDDNVRHPPKAEVEQAYSGVGKHMACA